MMVFTMASISAWGLPAAMAFTRSMTFTTPSPLISPGMSLVVSTTSICWSARIVEPVPRN